MNISISCIICQYTYVTKQKHSPFGKCLCLAHNNRGSYNYSKVKCINFIIVDSSQKSNYCARYPFQVHQV